MDNVQKSVVPCTCTPGIVRFTPCTENCPTNPNNLYPLGTPIFPQRNWFEYPTWRYPQPAWC